jgi:hypothetical protein
LPPRNLVFTGRQELLERLHASLRPGGAAAVVQAHALHGLGGVGKTQLALEYAHRHAIRPHLVGRGRATRRDPRAAGRVGAPAWHPRSRRAG